MITPSRVVDGLHRPFAAELHLPDVVYASVISFHREKSWRIIGSRDNQKCPEGESYEKLI
jgi:hypothetical protein